MPCREAANWPFGPWYTAGARAVPGEPRKRLPVAVVEKIIDYTLEHHLDDFEWVQFVFLLLTLLYSFSRSECPCPKSHQGVEAFDKNKHWTWADFVVTHYSDGKGGRLKAMDVRMKGYKQDPRMERPEARGEGGDWVTIGDLALEEEGAPLSTVEAAMMGTPSSSGSSNHHGRSARGSSRRGRARGRGRGRGSPASGEAGPSPLQSLAARATASAVPAEVTDLAEHAVEASRPSTRKAPTQRSRS